MKKYIALLFIPIVTTTYCIHYYFTHGTPFDIWLVEKMHYNERGKHADMARAYQPLVAKYPDRPDLKYSLAWAYYKTGHYAEARRLVNEYVAEARTVPRWRDRYIARVQDAGYTADDGM